MNMKKRSVCIEGERERESVCVCVLCVCMGASLPEIAYLLNHRSCLRFAAHFLQSVPLTTERGAGFVGMTNRKE